MLNDISEMRNEESLDYDLLKERVRQRFGLIAEQSRKEFRELWKKSDENYWQLAVVG